MPMSQNFMLHQMCQENLSNADIKAISQIRGFSAAESGSRPLFESFFLSDIGVEKAMKSLEREEIAFLHLLHSRSEAVDITFFSRVYPQESDYGTFTQKYQPILASVRTSLLRRGLLLMAESGQASDGESKMERWRFHFPQQFAHLLPPLLDTPATFATPGEVNHTVVRQKVMSLFSNKRFGLEIANDAKYQLSIYEGELKMGSQRFALEMLQTWQNDCWESAAPKRELLAKNYSLKSGERSLVAAARYAFSQLAANLWMTAEQLSPILKVFSNVPKPMAAKVCETGWEWGCLARLEVGGEKYYRLPTNPSDSVGNDYAFALTIQGNQIKVDLSKIEYADLETLTQVMRWNVEKDELIATPSLLKIGNLSPHSLTHPLLQWLKANSSVYAKALRTISQRWGKQIVHENLLIAKVNDLSLKVILQKALANEEQFLVLPNNFFAFPRALLPTIDKLVKQTGHVIKQLQAEAK